MTKFSEIEEVDRYLKNIEIAMSRPGLGGMVDTERAAQRLDEIANTYAKEFIRIFWERRNSPEDRISRFLIWPLRNVHKKFVLDFLTELLLKGDSFDERISAAMSLQYFDNFDLFDTFVEVLKDRDSSIQSEAVSYFEMHRSKKALPGLYKILEDKNLQKKYPGLINKAKKTVSQIENDI